MNAFKVNFNSCNFNMSAIFNNYLIIFLIFKVVPCVSCINLRFLFAQLFYSCNSISLIPPSHDTIIDM